MDILCIVPTLLFSGVSSVGNLHLSYIQRYISCSFNTCRSNPKIDKPIESYCSFLHKFCDILSKVMGKEMNQTAPRDKVKIR